MRLLMTVLMAVWLAVPARAADAPPPGDAAAVQAVISRQIEAFRRDDGAAAFAFATPDLQTRFGSAEAFMAMVRRGYQPVYRPGSVQFAAPRLDGDAVVQDVELTGPDGGAYTARYTLERQPDGEWRIAACVLLESARLGA